MKVKEHRRRTRARKLVFTAEVRCPAGHLVHETQEGTAVRCSVEVNTLSALRDPTSIGTYCLDQYNLCPSWELEKRRIEGNQRRVFAGEPPLNRAEFNEQVEVERDVGVSYFEQG